MIVGLLILILQIIIRKPELLVIYQEGIQAVSTMGIMRIIKIVESLTISVSNVRTASIGLVEATIAEISYPATVTSIVPPRTLNEIVVQPTN